MGDWPKLQVSRTKRDDATPAGYPTGWYTTITGGAAHTKGAYVTLVAAAPFDVNGMLLVGLVTAGGNPRLVDIAVGAAASEQVVLPNFPFQNTRTATAMDYLTYVPLRVPRGARIAARCQGAGAGDVVQARLILAGDGFAGMQGASRWAAYGADLAASAGSVVQADAGSVFGPYTELVASAPFTSRYAYLCMHNGGADDYTFEFSLGTTVAWGEFRLSLQQQPPAVFVPWTIPRGSQVQCRVRSVNGIDVRAMVVVGG